MPADTPEPNRIESLLLNLIFAAVSGALLAALFPATRSGAVSAGWWTRPAFAPGVALGLLVLANLLTLARAVADFRATPATAAEWRDLRGQVLGWLRPVEFLGYFALYLWSLHVAGYFAATLAFVFWLLLRTGLRSARWFLAGAGLVAALILVFRVGLGVWMPAPGLYEFFPDGVRSALIRWF